MADNEVNVKITATDDGFQAAIEQAKSALGDLPGHMQEAGEAARSFGSSLGKIGEIAAGVFGGFELNSVIEKATEALKEAVLGADEWAERLSNLSSVTGISTDVLQRLQFAAKITGTDVDGLGRSFLSLQRRLLELDTGGGSKAFRQAMEDLHLSRADLEDVNTAFDSIAAHFKEFEATLGAARSRADLSELLPRGQDLIPLIDNLDRTTEEFYKLHLSLAPDQVEAAKQAQEAMNALSAEWDRDKLAVGIGLSPAVTQLTGVLATLREEAGRTVQALSHLGDPSLGTPEGNLRALLEGTGPTVPRVRPPASTGASGGSGGAGGAQLTADDRQHQLDEQFRRFEAEQNLEVAKAGNAVAAKISEYQKELDWLTAHHEANTIQYINLESRKIDEIARMNEEQQRSLQKMWQQSAEEEKKALEAATKDAQKAAEEARKAAEQVGKAWDNALQPISQGFDQIFNGVLQGTQTATQAFRKMGEDIALSIAKSGIKDLLLGAPADSLGPIKSLFGTQGAGGGIAGALASVFGNVGGSAQGGAQGAAAIMGPAASGVIGKLFSQGFQAAQPVLQQVFGGAFQSIAGLVKGIFGSALSGAGQAAAGAAGGAAGSGGFGGVLSAITGSAGAAGMGTSVNTQRIQMHEMVLAAANAAAAKAFLDAMMNIPFPANLGAAPADAASTFAQVMVFNAFGRGGIVPPTAAMVSGGIPAMLHPNEMVLPRAESEMVQRAARRSGGDEGGHTVNVHLSVNTIDADGFHDLLSRNRGAIMGQIREAVRDAMVEVPTR